MYVCVYIIYIYNVNTYTEHTRKKGSGERFVSSSFPMRPRVWVNSYHQRVYTLRGGGSTEVGVRGEIINVRPIPLPARAVVRGTPCSPWQPSSLLRAYPPYPLPSSYGYPVHGSLVPLRLAAIVSGRHFRSIKR